MRLAGRVAAAIRDLHPSYFAFVMATGIISTGAFVLGPAWLSQALLVIASIGFVVLVAALGIWLARYRSRVVAEFRAPERVFGFFAISASCDLLGARFASAGHPMVTTVLACLAAVVWFVLTYGVPASLLLAPAAAALWSVGLVLYLLLVSLIWQRWLEVRMTPATLSAPYWILMGATGIIVLAGSDILTLPGTPPAVTAIAGFVKGTCFVFWSFGTWWIPLLIVLGFARHVLRQWPLRYEPALWTVVFPIGMYSVATLSFGKADGLSFMQPLSRGVLWVAIAAWLLVAAAGLARLARSPAPARHASDVTGST